MEAEDWGNGEDGLRTKDTDREEDGDGKKED